MRQLTLHEKINIKGLLALKTGLKGVPLAGITMTQAGYMFPRLYGISVAYHLRIKSRLNKKQRN